MSRCLPRASYALDRAAGQRRLVVSTRVNAEHRFEARDDVCRRARDASVRAARKIVSPSGMPRPIGGLVPHRAAMKPASARKAAMCSAPAAVVHLEISMAAVAASTPAPRAALDALPRDDARVRALSFDGGQTRAACVAAARLAAGAPLTRITSRRRYARHALRRPRPLQRAPYGLAGSVAASTPTPARPRLHRAVERSRSSAPGIANCVAPRPATK